MISYLYAALIAVGTLVIGILLGIWIRKRAAKRAEEKISNADEEALRIVNEAIKSAENKKREVMLEAKEDILCSRNEYEKEVKERRAEQQKQERRLQQKEENLDHKTEMIEKKEEALAQKHAAAESRGIVIVFQLRYRQVKPDAQIFDKPRKFRRASRNENALFADFTRKFGRRHIQDVFNDFDKSVD